MITQVARDIRALLDAHRDGYALPQGFYASDPIFAAEMEHLFLPEWHFAGLATEIPAAGDYMLFNLLRESVIICRDADGAIHALANVCRHRGSRVCTEPRGSTRRFTCPYHAWTYTHDGSLFSARLMDGIDRADLGLKPVAIEVFAGMIFLSFADKPTSFDRMRADLAPLLAPFAMDRLKVAARKSYPVKANWKLLVENYNECYHCATAHPEFSRSHPTHMDAERMKPLNAALEARAAALGIPTDTIDNVGPHCPEGSIDYTISRHSLYDGVMTGSDGGVPVAPLLGDIKGYDSGACDLYIGIFNPMLVYNDHAVIYRFIPVDRETSVQEIIWLVREDATEGQDYDLDRLTWLWDVTTVADKSIIEMNQSGVNSRYYTPGPLAGMEAYTRRFLDLYTARMARIAGRAD